jgi:hypothetical protein
VPEIESGKRYRVVSIDNKTSYIKTYFKALRMEPGLEICVKASDYRNNRFLFEIDGVVLEFNKLEIDALTLEKIN